MLKWYEMSYNKIDKENNENMCQRLRNECSDSLPPHERSCLYYSAFFVDDYSEESEA